MSAHRLILLTLAGFCALAILYSVTTPIFETPDEVWHYAYVRELALNHRWPVVDAEGKAPYRHEGLQPPLYYLIGAPLIGWMDARDLAMPAPNPFARIGEPQAATNDNRNAFVHTSDESFPFHGVALAVHLLRLYSILLGAMTVGLTFALARQVFPDDLVKPWGAAFVVAFLPQFLFISSAINNDNLATLLTTAVLWQITKGLRLGMTRRRAVALGLLAGAALLTKLNTIALVGLISLALLYVAWRSRSWRAGVEELLIVGGITALIAGGWYWRNWMLYGDPTTWARLAVLVGERVQPLSFWRWVSAEGEGLRLSTWGVFGWFNIRAAPEFYLFFDALAVWGLVGVLVAFVRRRGLSIRLALLPLWCALIFASLWRYASIIVTSQGRLLFPALPALATLWAWGVFTGWPRRWRRRTAAAIGVLLPAIALAVPFTTILPAYRPRVVTAGDIPPQVTRLEWTFENGIEWLGASVDATTARPGDSVPITVYARIPAGLSGQPALFLHVVNSAEVIVAQRDSLIGSGNQGVPPTPIVIADEYVLSIPVTVAAPDVWQVRAGLYDPATGKRLQARDRNGAALGDEPRLATLTAQRPEGGTWHYDFDRKGILVDAEFAPAVRLGGEPLALTLRWEPAQTAQPPLHLFVHALGQNDRIWASADTVLGSGIETRLELRFDPQTPPGVYPLEMGVYSLPTGDRLVIYDARSQPLGDQLFLGPIRVRAP